MAEVNTLIRSAGGVVWRPSRDAATNGVEIAVVNRPRYDDWSLPKGKLDHGEHPLAAAVREVFEETSARGVPQGRLPTIRYLTGEPGVEKLVDFWSMRAESWGVRAPDDEVQEVRWVPAYGAGSLLSYAHDRGVVKAFLDLPVITAMVAFVRHARAGERGQWPGSDGSRPLDEVGVADARKLAPLLALFRPHSVVSATPLRCQLTVAPLGLPVRTDPVFDEDAAPDEAAARLRELALPGGVTVVCSQGGLVSPVLSQLTGRANLRFDTRKGTAWMLAFAGGRLVGFDHLEPRDKA